MYIRIWTQSLGSGKEFERSNQIAALSKSCDYLPQEFGRTISQCRSILAMQFIESPTLAFCRIQVCSAALLQQTTLHDSTYKPIESVHDSLMTPFPSQRVGSGIPAMTTGRVAIARGSHYYVPCTSSCDSNEGCTFLATTLYT